MNADSRIRIGTLAHAVWRELIRRKDLYVLVILLAAMLTYLLNMNFFGSSSAVRYIAETGLLLAWLFSWVLTINLSARQLPTEERRGTIFPLLAKPVTRGELIVGKWLGGWLAACAGTLLYYAGVILAVRVRGGGLPVVTLLQGFVLHAALLSVIAAISILLSTRMNGDAAITLSYVAVVMCFLLVPKVPEMLMHADGLSRRFIEGLYWALPHFEFFDLRRRIVHGWETAPWGAFFGSLAYAGLWTGVLLALSWLGYRGKVFRRELVG